MRENKRLNNEEKLRPIVDTKVGEHGEQEVQS